MSITHQNIADHLGVARSLVGKALGGHPHVAEATRLRVEEVARELGYDPDANQGARVLIGKRYGRKVPTGVLAVLMGLRQADLALEPYFRCLMEGMAAEADSLGLELCYLECRNEDQLPRLIASGSVDATIILSFVPEVIGELQLRGLTYAGLTQRISGVSSVVADGYTGCYLATRHLLELGHREIAHVSHHLDFAEAVERRRGWKAALDERDLYRQELEECSFYDQREAPEAFGKIWARVPDVTAVVCYNDIMAMDIICYLQAQGYEVPGTISVVGFDDTAVIEGFEPALTSVSYDIQAMGRLAVKRVAELANGSQAKVEQLTVVDVELRIRETTAPPRQC